MDIKKVFKLIEGLASVQRYSQTRLFNKESVLEHAGFVGTMSYFLAKEIEHNTDHKIDYGVLLSRAIVHDIDEVVTGDIPRPTKYYNKETFNCLNHVAQTNMQNISRAFFDNDDMLNDWRSAKVGKEGSIIAMSDSLAIAYKAYDEIILRGNFAMISNIKALPRYLEECHIKIKIHYGKDCIGNVAIDAIDMCYKILGDYNEA